MAQRYLSPRGVGLDLYFYLSERIANFLIGYSITDGPLELLSCRLFLILALLTAFPGSSKHDVRLIIDERRSLLEEEDPAVYFYIHFKLTI